MLLFLSGIAMVSVTQHLRFSDDVTMFRDGRPDKFGERFPDNWSPRTDEAQPIGGCFDTPADEERRKFYYESQIRPRPLGNAR